MQKGFVFLDEVLCGLRWDAKYATDDNFVGQPVEGYDTNRIAGRLELAAALIEARERAGHRGFGLFLWDGYRPARAVAHFLRWAAQPEDGLTKARHYPRIDKSDMIVKGYVAARSSHSRGGAVDLTLYRLDTGDLLDMGTGFDFMDERSHHDAPSVGGEAARNRNLLRFIMEKSGFIPFDQEWWHYTLKDEPYPDQYFDFPLK